MEQAAALLVQTLFQSDDRMRSLLTELRASDPQAAANFLRPWYQAMLIMVKTAEAFDQGPSQRAPSMG